MSGLALTWCEAVLLIENIRKRADRAPVVSFNPAWAENRLNPFSHARFARFPTTPPQAQNRDENPPNPSQTWTKCVFATASGADLTHRS